MNPFVLSALSGLLKGVMFEAPPDWRARGFGDVLESATKEELLYRGALGFLGSKLPAGAGAVIFAADHVLNNGEQHSFGSGAVRFADVFLGGLLYERAFKSYGLLGAVAAHTAHNLAVAAGIGLKRRPKRQFAGCSPVPRRRRR